MGGGEGGGGGGGDEAPPSSYAPVFDFYLGLSQVEKSLASETRLECETTITKTYITVIGIIPHTCTYNLLTVLNEIQLLLMPWDLATYYLHDQM